MPWQTEEPNPPYLKRQTLKGPTITHPPPFKTWIVGEVNPNGGLCDCCTGDWNDIESAANFDDDQIVTEYFPIPFDREAAEAS